MCQTTSTTSLAGAPAPAPAPASSESATPPPTTPSYKFLPNAHTTPTKLSDHMSGLFFSGDVTNTLIEVLFLTLFFVMPNEYAPAGSMLPSTLGMFSVGKSLFTRFYNSYLEAVFFAFPQHRTQPAMEHKLVKCKQDLTGRLLDQQNVLVYHDRMTLITDSFLNLALYLLIPAFYPAMASSQSLGERLVRLVLNHYLMSLGMYWSHRALHVVPYLWNVIHSIHHYAKTPLSRVTYQDHWADNFGNAIVGQTFAQILIPMDLPTFVFSRIFRVAESLEKHSGHSSGWNLAHAVQFRWMPFAQMPHHHDWHHEGFKSCNYTFSSLGGVWDWVFGTRRAGRAGTVHKAGEKGGEEEPASMWRTREDKILNAGEKQKVVKSVMDHPATVVLPDLVIGAFAAYKLWSCGGSVCY